MKRSVRLFYTSVFSIFLGGLLVSCSDDDGKDDGMEPDQFTIWTGANITFTKADGADWTQEANQDRITDNVWITRADTKGIFNIKSETTYDGMGRSGNSPVDTEWAFGTTANIADLTFDTWAMTADGNPNDMVNQNMVVHLITDDVYIDLKFLSWSNAMQGGEGGFSYERSTQ